MPKKKTSLKKIELPLLKEIEEFYSDIFRQEDPRRTFGLPRLPEYLRLNLKHSLRSYQETALINLNYTQKDSNANSRFNQLLFHMATGSGKTDVMAAMILYLYAEFGSQNFLFVVNTNAVVAKTRENLVNSASPKYLFAPQIVVNGEKLDIREVTRFPENPEKGVIYLRLTTVQTLANELSAYRENGLTYEELSKQKLVILADEAHHFSAGTKSAGEKKDRAWENVLDRVRQANPANRQFEFTATIDLQNELIRAKYVDKIVAQYELSQFVRDQYSKKVRYLQANADDEQKMLNAVLLSQYRKMIAREAGVPDFKPVILFKSNQIAISKETRDKFLALISGLTVEKLADFIESSRQSAESKILQKVYTYFGTRNLAELVVELQRDFAAMNTINVNDTASDGILGDLNDLHNLNSLEEADNPFRAIFAVAKLSEGWDVLNLYDIVRISVGAEKAISKTATNSEAQLVGRGARYYPFEYQGEKSYQRRFDKTNSDLSVLEYLDYHTINEPKYLENLRHSLDDMDLPVEYDGKSILLTAKVKEEFKRTNVYQSGKLFYNKVEEIPAENWDSLAKYGVKIAELPEIDLSHSVIERENESDIGENELSTYLELIRLDARDQRLWKKAIARNPFYRFNNLRTYLPNLRSMSDFLTSEKWLGAISELQVRLSIGDSLSRERQLQAVEQYLAYIQRSILMNYKKQRGTKSFIGLPVSELVQDYEKKIPLEFNKEMSAHIIAHDSARLSWFPHDKAIVDGLEWRLIELIQSYIEDLRAHYRNVYLIRNEEQKLGIKLHEFAENTGDEAHYAGFMPDFILYLDSPKEIVQVYIEPKGTQLLAQDQWKEDLLESLNENELEILGEDEMVRLVGLRFYVSDDVRNIRNELQERVLPNRAKIYPLGMDLFDMAKVADEETE